MNNNCLNILKWTEAQLKYTYDVSLQEATPQELHEALRKHSQAAATEVKLNGKPNDLIKRIASDPLFGLGESEIERHLQPEQYTGRSASQTSEFLDSEVCPVLERYDVDDVSVQLNV